MEVYIIFKLKQHCFGIFSFIINVSQGHRAQAEESVPGDGGRQEVPLELVAAVLRERRGGHVGVHADPHAHAAAPDVTRRLCPSFRNLVCLSNINLTQ